MKSCQASGSFVKSCQACGSFVKSCQASGSFVKSQASGSFVKSCQASGSFVKSCQSSGSFVKNCQASGSFVKRCQGIGSFAKVRSVCNALLKDISAFLSVLIMSRPIWVKLGTGGSPRNAVEQLFHENRGSESCTLLKSVKKIFPAFSSCIREPIAVCYDSNTNTLCGQNTGVGFSYAVSHITSSTR